MKWSVYSLMFISQEDRWWFIKHTFLAMVFLTLSTTVKSQARKHERIKVDSGNDIALPPPMNPETTDDYDKIFTKVEKEATFPGGEAAWKKYLERNLDSSIAVKDSASPGNYKVKVSFIVDKEGNISDVHTYNPHKECPNCGIEAEKVIKKGPKWNPGIQNGKNVASLTDKEITFRVL